MRWYRADCFAGVHSIFARGGLASLDLRPATIPQLTTCSDASVLRVQAIAPVWTSRDAQRTQVRRPRELALHTFHFRLLCDLVQNVREKVMHFERMLRMIGIGSEHVLECFGYV